MRKRGEGREALIEAARAEFEARGFESTNSNAIARRAGYAPQTFYRHFDDKLAIFVTVYEVWAAEEAQMLAGLTDPGAVADVLITHHTRHRAFRRSLRLLTVTDTTMGEVRARVRLQQAEAFAARYPGFGRLGPAGRIAAILQVERLCDAIADGEFAACGIAPDESRAALTSLLSMFAQ
jgi:AcrR family transcriptional regulator